MKQLFIHRLISAGHIRKLCRPLGYINRQEILYSKEFTDRHISISIRPFSIEDDCRDTWKWICSHYSLHDPDYCKTAEQLTNTYSLMLQSDFAQPFIILLNDVPVCLAEVYCGQYHELNSYTDLQEGDYILELLMPPFKKHDRHILPCLLQACLHYFFSFSEVKRMISYPTAGNKIINRAMPAGGFEFIGKLEMEYKTANRYECCRDRFLQYFSSL